MIDFVWLISRDVVTVTEDCSLIGYCAYVNCNDTFGYATADAEEITPADASQIRQMYEKFHWPGVWAWCSVKRGVLPIEELQTGEFFAAREECLKLWPR